MPILTLISSVFLFLVVCGMFAFLADRVFGGLDFATGQDGVNQVVGVIKQRHLENRNFYDLGSARGTFACKIAKALPNLHVRGIDGSNFRVLWSNLTAIFIKNLKFKKENFFKTDVSSADIVYLYLPQQLMPGLQAKLQKELKPGSLVISKRVSFPDWQPVEKLKELFIYAKA